MNNNWYLKWHSKSRYWAQVKGVLRLFQSKVGIRVDQRRMGRHHTVLGHQAASLVEVHRRCAHLRRRTRYQQKWKRGIVDWSMSIFKSQLFKL